MWSMRKIQHCLGGISPQIHTLKACFQHMLNVTVWGLWRGDLGTKRSRGWALSSMTGVPWGQERRTQTCMEGRPRGDTGWKQPSTWQGDRPQEELACPHLTSSCPPPEGREKSVCHLISHLWHLAVAIRAHKNRQSHSGGPFNLQFYFQIKLKCNQFIIHPVST